MAQAVSSRPPSAEPRISARGSQCGTWWTKWHWDRFIPPWLSTHTHHPGGSTIGPLVTAVQRHSLTQRHEQRNNKAADLKKKVLEYTYTKCHANGIIGLMKKLCVKAVDGETRDFSRKMMGGVSGAQTDRNRFRRFQVLRAV
jgi:hypothetical protein